MVDLNGRPKRTDQTQIYYICKVLTVRSLEHKMKMWSHEFKDLLTAKPANQG